MHARQCGKMVQSIKNLKMTNVNRLLDYNKLGSSSKSAYVSMNSNY